MARPLVLVVHSWITQNRMGFLTLTLPTYVEPFSSVQEMKRVIFETCKRKI